MCQMRRVPTGETDQDRKKVLLQNMHSIFRYDGKDTKMNEWNRLLLGVIGFMLIFALCLLLLGCDSESSPVVGDSPMLAPGIPPLSSTAVYSMWGSTTYHRNTCRFIITSKKPNAWLFSFKVEKASEMGLKPCSNCFKAQKIGDT